jgi:signal transduction histidine kinase
MTARDDFARRPHPGGSPIIKTPPGPRADPAVVSERLTGLTHDLAGLLDGSMRQVGMLLRAGLDPADEGHRRLLTVKAALEQMSALVTAAARGHSVARGTFAGSSLGPTPVMSMLDAVQHAAAITEPWATEQGITLKCSAEPELAHADARGVYTVLVNSLRNSVESILRRRPRKQPARGRIEIVATVARGDERDEPGAIIRITDDGEGPPAVAPGRQGPDVFAPGYTTKTGSLGIGLSMARDIILAAGGTIRLAPHATPEDPCGAQLTIVLPPRPMPPMAGAA